MNGWHWIKLARRPGGLMIWVGAALFCSSCEQGPATKPVFPTQGKILFEGKPITPATVVFHPVNSAQKERPAGKTRQDGVYKLSTYGDKDGAPPGEYIVTVTWTPAINKPDGDSEPGPNKLPTKYSKPETSDLKAKIVEGGNDIETFDLKQ